jgi:HprK-related kinase A
LKLASLSPSELASRLREGLHLQTGAFTVSVRSEIPSVAHGLGLMYADYLLGSGEFADFHVSLTSPRNLRRWLKPQVLFHCEGSSPFTPLPYSQAFPMLEWGLNWCVSAHANNYLMIHAAVVEKDGRAAILPAPPGSGKSTLCAALVNRGWRLLSDELTMIRLSDGNIEPLPRPVSLKNASIDVIKRFAPEAVFSPSVKDTIKGTVAHMKPQADAVAHAVKTVRAAWIVFPKYEAGAPVTLQGMSRAQAFMRVAGNSFNYDLLAAESFRVLADVIEGVDAYDFRYSALDDAIQTFATLPLPSPIQERT